MRAYLKGYYGYRNIGDEVLLLGVLHYIHRQLGVTHVTIEADNPDRLRRWLVDHSAHYDVDVECVHPPRRRYQKIRYAVRSLCGSFPLLVLGGGEVINMKHSFPHNGRNYVLQFPGIALRTQRYYLLGGVTTGETIPRHVSLLVRNASSVILRDQTSYDTIEKLAPSHTTLYHDRAYDALGDHKRPQHNSEQESDYVILNIHPHVYEKDTQVMDTMRQRLHAHQTIGKTIYFVPGDIAQDHPVYQKISQTHPEIQRRDRSELTLPEILRFFAKAESIAASRLHILLLAQHIGHTPLPLSYHPKIQKVLGL